MRSAGRRLRPPPVAGFGAGLRSVIIRRSLRAALPPGSVLTDASKSFPLQVRLTLRRVARPAARTLRRADARPRPATRTLTVQPTGLADRKRPAAEQRPRRHTDARRQIGRA